MNDMQQQIDDLRRRLDQKDSQPLRYPIDPVSLAALVESLKTTFSSFSSAAMWGKVTLVSGTKTVSDSRIKATSTVLLTGDTSGTSDLLFAYPVAAGSVVIGSNGSNNFGVYYLIIF
jgi:hypothetical protein